MCLYAGGYLAQVIVCNQVFQSTQVRTKKVEAEQDAAKLAFEHLQQDQQSDDVSAASKSMILMMGIISYSVELAVCLPTEVSSYASFSMYCTFE